MPTPHSHGIRTPEIFFHPDGTVSIPGDLVLEDGEYVMIEDGAEIGKFSVTSGLPSRAEFSPTAEPESDLIGHVGGFVGELELDIPDEDRTSEDCFARSWTLVICFKPAPTVTLADLDPNGIATSDRAEAVGQMFYPADYGDTAVLLIAGAPRLVVDSKDRKRSK